ncbi:MAG: hypothetical protein H0U53_00215, partial [Actinobacteria bacterium]|nr:hypothetical protein [Actinomycetota bacterium]
NLEARHVTINQLKAQDVTLNKGSVRLRFYPKGAASREDPLDITIRDPVIVGIFRKHKAGKIRKEKIFEDMNGKKIKLYMDRVYPEGFEGEEGFSAHDLRAVFVTEHVAAMIAAIGPRSQPKTQAEFDKRMKLIFTTVGNLIGDKPDVTRNSYTVPEVYEKWAADLGFDARPKKDRKEPA